VAQETTEKSKVRYDTTTKLGWWTESTTTTSLVSEEKTFIVLNKERSDPLIFTHKAPSFQIKYYNTFRFLYWSNWHSRSKPWICKYSMHCDLVLYDLNCICSWTIELNLGKLATWNKRTGFINIVLLQIWFSNLTLKTNNQSSFTNLNWMLFMFYICEWDSYLSLMSNLIRVHLIVISYNLNEY